jgi:hypothetical protein
MEIGSLELLELPVSLANVDGPVLRTILAEEVPEPEAAGGGV